MNQPRLLKADEIEVKVKQVFDNGAIALMYKTARVDMAILDETYGAENWKNHYEVVNDNLYCTIEVWDSTKSQWIAKSDCGVESNTEAEKGEASDAFKRAGFRWGIGRELYTSPFIWLKVATERGSDGKSYLKDKRQRFNVRSIEFDEKKTIVGLIIEDENTHEVVYTLKNASGKPAAPQTAKDDLDIQAAPVKPMESPRTLQMAIHEQFKLLDPEQTTKMMEWTKTHYNTMDIDSISDPAALKYVLIVITKAVEKAKGEKQ